MDVLIRYFHADDNKIKTRYLDSHFLRHSTHTNLLREYNKALKDLCENKLVQISMDGPNVNLKLLEKVNEERTPNELHRLISIGSCGLHTIHDAFRAGTEATEWSIKKILTGAHVLHDNPARRENYQEVTGSNRFPLNLCSTW